MSSSSQSPELVGIGSDVVALAELTRMVEVVGGSGLPKAAGGGTPVTVGSVTVGVAVTTIMVVVEPSTTSTVATMTSGEGVTVTVAVDATVWLVVSVTV